MNTPIYDFINKYIELDVSRFHMPGHKGENILGIEKYDLTEIKGADDLYNPHSIILESENNATELFGSKHTCYATNGSTQCIKAMLYLAYVNSNSNSNVILSTRNVHKAFINSCSFLDLNVEWLYPDKLDTICSCVISDDVLDKRLNSMQVKPFAVFVTSPDYLGAVQDIKTLSIICKKYNIPLLVDNAHGAYLKFLKDSLHPLDLGADMCCDSAHKTLPVLTGGAYLHISKNSCINSIDNVRNALSMFGSSSPSYLVLASLDLCNKYLSDEYRDKLAKVIDKVNKLKVDLTYKGIVFSKSEPLKIVINTAKIGYNGSKVADYLRKNNIECEFADNSYVVLMYNENNREEDFIKLKSALIKLQIKPEIKETQITYISKKSMSIRKALLSKREKISVENAENRICVSTDLLCPPAIPIIVSGEIIDKNTIELLKFYNIKEIDVVKEKVDEL